MSTWKHGPLDTYMPIATSAWMNERGYGITHTPISEPTTHEQAVKRGFERVESDDFNIGAIRDGRLAALLWMGEVIDDDPAVLAEIAGQLGIEATR